MLVGVLRREGVWVVLFKGVGARVSIFRVGLAWGKLLSIVLWDAKKTKCWER